MAEPTGQGSVDSANQRGSTAPAGAAAGSSRRDPITSPSSGSPAAFLESVWMQLALELEARLKQPTSKDEEDRSASLAVRLAMMANLLEIKADEAERLLDLASAHPLVPRLGWVNAIEQGSEEELRTVEMLVDGLVVDREEKSFFLRDIAEAWLYRFGHAGRAARAARSGLDTVAKLTSGIALELRELFFLSLAVAEEWGDYVGFLAQSVATAEEIDQRERLSMFIEAVHTSLDWLDRPDNAAKLIRRRFDLLGPLPDDAATRALYLHAIDLSLDVADAASDRHRIDRRPLLERRLELAMLAEDAAEVAISQLLLAGELRQKREHAELYDLFAAVPSDGSWVEHFRHRELARSAAVARRWPEALRALASAAGSGASLASSYRCRLAELAEIHRDDDLKAADEWRAVLASGISSPQAYRRLESGLIRQGDGELVDFLHDLAKGSGGRQLPLTRRAYLRELRDNPTQSTKRVAAALAEADDATTIWEHFLVVNLFAHGAQSPESAEQLMSIGESAIAHLGRQGQEIGPTLMSYAGLISLVSGEAELALPRLARALAADSGDLCSALVLAHLYRQLESWQELASTLERIAAEAVSNELLIAILRELADVLGRRLGASKRARRALESALKIDPDDPAVIRQLAEISDGEAEWQRSVELRSKAVALAPGQTESAELLVEIGTIEEERQRDDDALAAFRRALEIDSVFLGALRGAARILRRRGEHAELLNVLRREVELIDSAVDVATIHLDIARTLTTLKADPAEILDAYRSAISADPQNDNVLFALVDAARRHQRFDLIVESCRLAPRNERNLRWLCEGLAHQSMWQELVDTQNELLELIGDSEKVGLHCEIARVYREELLDNEAAVSALRRALDLDPTSKRAQAALDEILGSESDSEALEAEWEAEIAKGLDDQPERKFVLELRLGKARHLRGEIEGALAAYEGARSIHPDHRPTLEILATIYSERGSEAEWLDVVSSLAAVVEQTTEKSDLYRSIAERSSKVDTQSAIEAWMNALRANPADRDVFTAAEAYFYENEAWSALMELYDHCIHLAEDAGLRAYRLADLYKRRALVEDRYLEKPEVAAATYSLILELEPDDVASIEELENLYARTESWRALITKYERLTEITSEPELRIEACRRAARVASGELNDDELSSHWYLRVLDLDPDDEEALAALEESATMAQDWGRLIEVLRKRLDVAPAGNRTTYLLSRIAKICEQKLFDDERAITYYQRILESSPGHRGALESLARIYESTGRWADFVDVTKRQIKVTRERSQKALLYFRCGSVMEAKFGEEDEAVRYYQAAIKTSPTCMPAVHGLRDVWRRRLDWPKVVQTLELEVKLWDSDRERAGVFAQIGNVYAHELDDRERAHHYFESALAVDPDCIPANRALFDAFFDEKAWHRALPLSNLLAQRSMREGDPVARAEFYRRRAVVCRMVGEGTEAAEAALTSLEIRSENPLALEALNDIARQFPEAFDFKDTFAELRRLYRSHQDSSTLEARVVIGESIVLEGAGDLEGARDALQEALEIAPGDPSILSAYVDLQQRRRLFEDAEAAIIAFLERSGAEVGVEGITRVRILHAGLLANHLGRDSDARVLLQTIVSEDEGAAEARYLLAQLCFSAQELDAAAKLVDEVIGMVAAPGEKVQPRQLARFYFFLGRINEEQGNERAALTSYRRAADYDPGYAAPNLALAARAARAGDLASAQSTLFNAAHQAIGSVNKEAAVPLQRGLARLQARTGEISAAIDAYRGMLSVAPHDVFDRYDLATLYRRSEPLRAIRELLRIINYDVRFAPAYRELAECYRDVDSEGRALRVDQVAALLQLAGRTRNDTQPVPASLPIDLTTIRGIETQDVTGAARSSVRKELVIGICRYLEEHSRPLDCASYDTREPDETLQQLIECARAVFAVDRPVRVADDVPFLVEVAYLDGPVVLLDRETCKVPGAARFLVGYAFEALREGYGFLLQRSRRARRQLEEVLDAANGRLSLKGKELLARLPQSVGSLCSSLTSAERAATADQWIEAQLDGARCGGLLFADDLIVASEQIARISGGAGNDPGDAAATAILTEIPDVVRFYLSDGYQALHQQLYAPDAVGAE